jgi:hypothetical protein
MAADLQSQLFQHLRNRIPEHVSLVDELATILDVSTDSAYRRIRGEKALSFEEVYKICIRFQLSLDSLLNLTSGAFLFSGSFVRPSVFRFDKYMEGVVQQVKTMSSFKEKQLYSLCKDIPIFHHFHFRELAAFKYFFWMKTLIQHPDFNGKKFSFEDYPNELFELGRKALVYYNQIDSIELWNIESISSSIRQIEFHHESGGFENDDVAYSIYDALEKTIVHLEQMIGLGYKFEMDDASKTPKGIYELYFNEVMLGDNSFLAVLDGSKIGFLVHSTINILHTRDSRFTEAMYDHIQNLIRKSTLLSAVGESERARFFKHLRNRIASRKQNLKT